MGFQTILEFMGRQQTARRIETSQQPMEKNAKAIPTVAAREIETASITKKGLSNHIKFRLTLILNWVKLQ